MEYINALNYKIELGPLAESSFQTVLESTFSKSKKVILVDENTHENCLSYLIGTYDALSEAEVIQLPSGEENKSIEIVHSVWEALTEYGVSRHDLIINLGGGVISDMGGFIASCFKRGVAFINIPTTLLSMVDASIGGKTGVNLGPYKNQIGVFSNPKAVYIDTSFLATLNDIEVSSGFGEMIKHGLLDGEDLWNKVFSCMRGELELDYGLLKECIEVKNKIVQQDALENAERKLLNIGHTIAHVIEGYYMTKMDLTHGYCVAIGIVMEAYLSTKKGVLSPEMYEEIEGNIGRYYLMPEFTDEDIKIMVSMLNNDKKNAEGKIRTCLIEQIGKCTFDNVVSEDDFLEVFLHFKNLQLSLN